MRQVRPAAFGGGERGLRAMLRWPGGQPGRPWSRCTCTEPPRWGWPSGNGNLGSHMSQQLLRQNPWRFYTPDKVCVTAYLGLRPPTPAPLRSWDGLIHTTCSPHFVLLFRHVVRPGKKYVGCGWRHQAPFPGKLGVFLGLNCIWPVLNVGSFWQGIKGMGVIWYRQLSGRG